MKLKGAIKMMKDKTVDSFGRPQAMLIFSDLNDEKFMRMSNAVRQVSELFK